MERKIGMLGIKPMEAKSFGHSGRPGKSGATEHFLHNKLNLNIVYSVYHQPKTMAEIAEELGNPRVANMVMLGAYIEKTKCVEIEHVLDALLHKLGEKKAHTIPVNREALERGAAAVR